MAATTELPAPAPIRSRTLLVGTVFGIASTVMVFAGLFGIYLRERALTIRATGSWIPSDATIELSPPTVMAWTLILSAVTVQWAVYSVARDDRRHTYMALGLTVLFGIAIINQTVFQWRQMGLVIDEGPSPAAPLIYTISGAFVVALVIGMVFLALMAFRALAGQYSSRQTDGIVAASMYWYTLVVLYFVIWILVYITK
ncbi:MAG: cytochrome c oxidase subunit 3 [Acidimicrobiales bacterium]|nr:cytochrome c oxidase subunit 3 [Acidimicrobiales bacterium]